MTVAAELYEYYVGTCPLSEEHYIRTARLFVSFLYFHLHAFGCRYADICYYVSVLISLATVGTDPGTF